MRLPALSLFVCLQKSFNIIEEKLQDLLTVNLFPIIFACSSVLRELIFERNGNLMTTAETKSDDAAEKSC